MGDSKLNLETRRAEKFKDAIKAYEWAIAETLAWTEEEMQDLDDSKLRVELMTAAKVQGDFEKAHAYAITEAERDEIEAYRGTVAASLGEISTEQEAAAAKMQARIRGSQVREQNEKERMSQAAVIVQKSFRGHSERDAQEEQRRLTWLQCAARPRDALPTSAPLRPALPTWPPRCRTLPRAATHCSRARLQVAPGSGRVRPGTRPRHLQGGAAEDLGRQGPPLLATPRVPSFLAPTTVRHSGISGRCILRPPVSAVPTAAQLIGSCRAIGSQSKSEQANFCACFAFKQRPQGRKEKFVAAIRNYDWDAAQLLAVGDEERQDLEDSKNRVAWMLHYTAEGKYEEVSSRARDSHRQRRRRRPTSELLLPCPTVWSRAERCCTHARSAGARARDH